MLNSYYPFYIYQDEPLGNGFYKIGLEKKENSVEVYPPKSIKNGVQFVWRWGKDKALKFMNQEIVGYETTPNEFRIVQKMRHEEKIIRSLLTDTKYSSRRGTAEVEEIFGNKVFQFPKPITLLEDFCKVGLMDDDIVLDFFSGSATLANAIININSKDNGKRKFILVQLPESCSPESTAYEEGYANICEIGKERIRRAGDKIKSENPDANIDVGFKVFRVADTNIKWNSLMDMGQLDVSQIESTPDLMDFMPNTKDIDVVYELMLRQRDVALSESVELLSDIGNRTYLYASSFLVCLETEVTAELVEKIAAIDPIMVL